MSKKRSIDIQREAAITLDLGGDDKSAAKYLLSTGSNIYAIKEMGVYKIQLTDDIDPSRINPDIPNLNQQVLSAGCDNEIVAKILLTAQYLFDEHSSTVKPFIGSLFESCIVLTRQMLELDARTTELAKEITDKEAAFADNPAAPNSVILPSIPSLEAKVHNILSTADKARDTFLAMCRSQFLPNADSKSKLADLESAIEQSLLGEPKLIAAWKGTAKYFTLIRNARNASEHPKEGHRIVLSYFAMRPNGKVYPPLIDVQHQDTPIRTLHLSEFLEFIRNAMLVHAEDILAFIRVAFLMKENPFKECVIDFPEEERRHKFVRYYRALNFGGKFRILG